MTTIEIIKEAMKVSKETGRNYHEIRLEMLGIEKKTSKGTPMTKKEIARAEFKRNYKPEIIEDMHAYNRVNALKNLPSSMR